MTFPETVHIFISARFLGNPTEDQARELNEELKNLKLKSEIVDVAAGDDFGDIIMH